MTSGATEEFETLDDLRGRLAFYNKKHYAALHRFFEPKVHGFKHLISDKPKRLSLSSSATCYVSAINSGLERPDDSFLKDVTAAAEVIAAVLEREWDSAKLTPNNAFSSAFALELIAEVAWQAAERGAKPELLLKMVTQGDNQPPVLHPKLSRAFTDLVAEICDGKPMGDSDARKVAGGKSVPAPERAPMEKAATAPPSNAPISSRDEAPGIVPKHADNVEIARADVDEAEDKRQGRGYIAMAGYPPSSYLTQLALRALRTFSRLLDHLKLEQPRTDRAAKLAEVSQAISSFARGEMYRQVCLHVAHAKSADAFQLAYSLILDQMTIGGSDLSSDHKELVDLAVRTFFDTQLPDGSWPRSQVLFHYPDVGNAYCFEFELIAQLLERTDLDRYWLANIGKFRDLVAFADRTRSREDHAPIWSSGHHPQNPQAESWATASVYEAFFGIRKLASEKGRLLLFSEVGVPYPDVQPADADFAPDLLDSTLKIKGLQQEEQSLKLVLEKCIAGPIRAAKGEVERGYSFPEKLPTCMLFFGPPGTSKTELAKVIAKYLGWPHLTIDTSYFLRFGTDRVQAQADRLFKILAQADRVVVLLDEFDEMVLDRSVAAESASRFLTTSMLPKLSVLNTDRRIVFIVATNYIEKFDLAIRRGGRFDAIVQVMPPTYEAKKAKWPNQIAILEKDGLDPEDLKLLTFLEIRQMVDDVKAGLKAKWKPQYVARCTMKTTESGANGGQGRRWFGRTGRTWFDACLAQEDLVRIPNLSNLDK